MLKRVLKLTPVVQSEIQRGGYPFPAELILGLMQYESGGKIGAVNEKSGASGLIQVMPGTLAHFNKSTGSNVALSTMRSKDLDSAAIQLRVGLWVLGQYWRKAFQFLSETNRTTDVPLDDLVMFGDSFYAAGPGKVKKMSRGIFPLTWSSWSRRYPTSNITKHADRVWARTKEQNPTWNLSLVDKWIQGKSPKSKPVKRWEPEPKTGLMLGLVLIMLASYFMSKKKGLLT